MAQTAAHLVDHVIPPVPVRQWAISVPKRLRGFLADRPAAVSALTKIFLDEIERLLCAAADATPAAKTSAAPRPRLGAVSPASLPAGPTFSHWPIWPRSGSGSFSVRKTCLTPSGKGERDRHRLLQADLAAVGVWLVFC